MLSGPAHSASLLEIYQQALQGDPQIHEAEARRLSAEIHRIEQAKREESETLSSAMERLRLDKAAERAPGSAIAAGCTCCPLQQASSAGLLGGHGERTGDDEIGFNCLFSF